MAANQTVNIYGVEPFSPIAKNATAQKREILGLSFPLGSNKTTGGFFKKEGNIAVIRDSVTQLLKTERGERIMIPNFGCNLKKYLFQPLDEIVFESIKEEILYACNRYIKGAEVVKLSVTPFGAIGPAGGNSLKITLLLKLIEEDFTVFDAKVIIK